MLADYRAAAKDERRREGEAREEASRAFHWATHPVTRRSRCCVAPPDGKRGGGTDDLRDNGGTTTTPPPPPPPMRAAPWEERGAIRTD